MRQILSNRAFWALAVFVITSAVYWRTVNFSFVRLDDDEYVYQNTHICGGVSVQCAAWAMSDVGYASNWHPFTWISHATDVSIARMITGDEFRQSGGSPSYVIETDLLSSISHLHNVLLHSANATLLFLLVSMLGSSCACKNTTRLYGCAILTFAWAIHPLRSEVVCWISERKELLCTLFMLLTLLSYCKNAFSWKRYLVAFLCYVFALFSKPTAVSLPVAMMMWDCIFGGKRMVGALKRILPFAVLSGVICVLTMCAQKDAIEVGNNTMRLGQRIVSAIEAPAIYLRQMVWPVELSSLYATGGGVSLPYLITGVLLIAAMGWCIFKWMSNRGWLNGVGMFSIAWIYVGLVPMLGIVKAGGQPHSDRYTYWIGCGVVAGVAIIWTRYSDRIMHLVSRRWSLAVVLGGFACLVSATDRQNSIWENSISLFSDAVSKTADEDSAMILADEMCRQGPECRIEAIKMRLRA